MKKGKRLLALVVAMSLVAGLAPMSSTSYAEETEATLNETLLLSDDFSGDAWNTTIASPVGCWRLGTGTTTSNNYAGSIDATNGTAPLGNTSSNRNLYFAGRDADSVLTDVHIKSKVCVTGEYVSGTNSQYHLLFARGANTGTNGVVFGFKTGDNPTGTSLVVGLYQQNDAFTSVYYETDEVYSLNQEYELELYVIGESFVIAKCEGETIFADVVSGIPTSGHCGIIDRRASSSTSTTTYGEGGYQKGGYFDDVSISTITLDGFKVNGPVIVDQTGVGVADITITSGGVDIAELQDVSVTIAELAGNGCSLYEGNYNVTTTLSGEARTATANRVFVVESIGNAVTSMSDERWTGKTAESTPNFTVDGLGKATLTNSPSVLKMGGTEDLSYDDFYVEYTLNVSELKTTGAEFAYTRFNTYERATRNSTFSADVQYDYRTDATSRQFFYSRLMHWTGASSYTQKGTYSSGTTENDIALGQDINISFMVYNGQITFKMNGNTVGTANYDNATGWFALHKDSASNGVVTVEDFIYVPLTEKAVVDLEVAEIGDIQLYSEITTPAVTPIYNWTNGQGEATTDGVTIEGFDNTRVGEQTVTVKYTENNVNVAKEMTVNVVDNSETTLVDFNKNEATFEGWTTSTNAEIKDVDNDGDTEVFVGENANVKSADTFKDGYIEAKVAINKWTDTQDGTKYPMVLDCKRASSGGARVEARFVVTKASNDYSAYFELVVREGNNLGSKSTIRKTVKTLSDFALGNEYTVRLTCIGNYVEVMLDDTILQYTFTADTLDTVDGTYGFTNVAGVTATLDDLKVVKYTPYTIAVDAAQTVSIPSYPIVQATNTVATRTKFAPGEQIVLTVPEDKQLAVGGLRYTIDGVSTSYSVTERRYGAGQERDVCNQFVFNMPSGNITLTADYYGDGEEETNANIGIKGVDVRKKTEDKKLGLRFSSRAYQTYVKDDVTYKLDEVGTLLFNEKVSSITDDIKNACRISEGGIYKDGDTTVGKCITATKAQDICNEFIDWGLILTYEADSEFIDTKYTACSYAKYVDDNGTEIYVYGDTTTYSIATVAESIGYEIQ